MPIIRTFAPFVAGVGQMKRATFAAYNFAGGFAWVTMFIWGGYLFGNVPLDQRELRHRDDPDHRDLGDAGGVGIAERSPQQNRLISLPTGSRRTTLAADLSAQRQQPDHAARAEQRVARASPGRRQREPDDPAERADRGHQRHIAAAAVFADRLLQLARYPCVSTGTLKRPSDAR